MRISDWSSDVCSSDLIFSVLHILESSGPLPSPQWAATDFFAAFPGAATAAARRRGAARCREPLLSPLYTVAPALIWRRAARPGSRCALALRVRMLFGRLKSKASMAAFLVLGGLALAPQLASAAAGGWAEEEQARLRLISGQDRKSTRLNSSP